MNRSRCGWCLAVLVVAVAMNARAQALDDATPPPIEEDDESAPVDWGYGPGVPPNNDMRAAQEMIAAPAAAPVGGPDAQTKGVFGPPVTWPIIAIHAVILPDGRVMNYGTNKQGQQGAELMYDVWDPKQGRGNGAHTVLPNTTNTDIFCGAQSVIPASGEVLITGGDKEINGEQHFSDRRTSVFHPRTNKITTSAPMQYARWYPTLVGLPTGEMLVLGGRKDKVPETPARTPEAFTQNVGWRTLSGATSDAAFGAAQAWYYPRAFVAPDGKVFVLGKDGKMFYVDPAGRGTITQLRQQTLRSTYYAVPSVMFAPGRILSVRTEKKVIVVDLNDREPAITQTAGLSQVRIWASGTVMADGKVLVTGGSAVANQLTGAAYAAEIWNPATGRWTLGAKAAKPRLYHSTALLLPDASVLTAGGGAPGPIANLNAEIYYPGYLYKKDGSPASRASLVHAPDVVRLSLNRQFTATVGSGNQISRVTLVRTGSVTHSFNPDQRFQRLSFTQAGQTLTITLPTTDPNVVLPGYHMLFVFDQAGVPSVAKIVHVLS